MKARFRKRKTRREVLLRCEIVFRANDKLTLDQLKALAMKWSESVLWLYRYVS